MVDVTQIGYAYADVNLCADTAYTTIDVELCSGIDEVHHNAMQIYPNPSSDNFTITFSDRNTVGELEIMNVLGRMMIHIPLNGQPSVRLSVGLKAGNYLVLLRTAEAIETQQLTIVK